MYEEDLDLEDVIEEKFRDTNLETKILAYAARRDVSIISILSKDYFTIEAYQLFLDILYDRNITLAKDVMAKIVQQKVKRKEYDLYKEYILKVYKAKIKSINRKNVELLVNDLKRNFKSRYIIKNIGTVVHDIENFNLEKTEDLLRESITVDIAHSYSAGDYLEDFEERLDHLRQKKNNPDKYAGIKLGIRDFDAISGGVQKGELMILMAQSGKGKCFKKGTEIMMYAGHSEKVENLKVGDLVMGADSNCRTIEGMCRGEQKMYEIIPKKGKPFTINEDHILSFKVSSNVNLLFNNIRYKKGEIINISLKDYLGKSIYFKQSTKLWRTGVKFEAREINKNIDPYFLGLWLGDGTGYDSSITNPDREIIDYLEKYAKKKKVKFNKIKHESCPSYRLTKGLKGSSKINYVYNGLKEIGVLRNKHIPDDYKYNTEKIRLKVLAGLIDTDGFLNCNSYEICTKFEKLNDDILFVARSLGFAAYSSIKKVKINNKIKEYFIIYISGEVKKIPCRVKRKIAKKRKQIKNVLYTGIKEIKCKGIGNYYGFSLEEDDKLFLLKDFTVVHNSAALGNFGMNAWLKGKNILFISLEMTKHQVQFRLDSRVAMIEHRKFRTAEMEKKEALKWKKKIISLRKEMDSFYEIICLPRRCNTNQIMNEAYKIQDKRKKKLDLIIVDYINLMSPNSYKGNIRDWANQAEIAYDLHNLTIDFNNEGIPIFSANQVTDEYDPDVKKKDVPVMEMKTKHMKYARGISEVTQIILGLSQTKEQFLENRMKLEIVKCRDFKKISPITLKPNLEFMILDEEMDSLDDL